MAGEPDSVFRAVEGIEDKYDEGVEIAKKKGINKKDFVIGISASGRTPYVHGILNYSKKQGAKTAIISVNYPKQASADFFIIPQTGPEVLTGSTRLKAASATKMILNMITTATMAKLGKIYGNLMVDLNPNSLKLLARGSNIIKEVTGCSDEQAQQLIKKSQNAKVGIVMYLLNVEKDEAQKVLGESNNQLRCVIEKNQLIL